MAAVLPTRLRKRSFAEIGLRVGRLGLILRVLCATCVIVFPILFAGILLLKHFEVQLPLCPVIPEKRWFSWLAYQFMYVAVAEEMFFRGYFQSNVLRLLTMSVQKNRVFLELIGIIVSATVFAISHSVLLGSVMPIITFFPGLIFGWLLVKTKSLLTPVLFHGSANVCYAFIGAVLA
jgi:membrane protease YdiL (CAAX protease family)